jgi:hypothetical protein
MDPTPRLPDAAASVGRSDQTIGSTGTAHEERRRLRGWRLLVARVAWLAVVVLTLGLAIPGFLVALTGRSCSSCQSCWGWWTGWACPIRS